MTRRAWSWPGLVILAVTGCASPDVEGRFPCFEGRIDCPAGQTCLCMMKNCPDVLDRFHACGSIPGMFGHDWLQVSALLGDAARGKPVGCVVTLPYEDPAAPGVPVLCTCVDQGPVAENHAAWQCSGASAGRDNR